MRALLLCLLAALSALPTAQAAQPAEPDYKVVGYYIAWGRYGREFAPDKIDAAKLTHINYAFANIQDGKVVLGDPTGDVANFKALHELKKVNPKLKVLVSVGGWSWSKYFSDVALTAKSRKVFADSAVDYMQTHKLDGVDIDWEFPVSGGDPGNVTRPEDKRNFTLLLQALRQSLDVAGKKAKTHYLLTIATNPGPTFVQNTELDKVAKTVDWINLMGYDFHGSFGKKAGPNAPLFADPQNSDTPNAAVLNAHGGMQGHLKAGVPAHKLVLGVPFYGYSWKGCPPAQNGQYQTCAGPAKGTWEDGALDYWDIAANYVGKGGFVRTWNEATKTPSLWNPDGGIYITYDDPQSMGHKIDYVKQHKFGGIMIWELTSDRERALLKPIADALLPSVR